VASSTTRSRALKTVEAPSRLSRSAVAAMAVRSSPKDAGAAYCISTLAWWSTLCGVTSSVSCIRKYAICCRYSALTRSDSTQKVLLIVGGTSTTRSRSDRRTVKKASTTLTSSEPVSSTARKVVARRALAMSARSHSSFIPAGLAGGTVACA
jgi:hypothetical protein